MRNSKILMIILSTTILLASCAMVARGANEDMAAEMAALPAEAPMADFGEKRIAEESISGGEFDESGAGSASIERIVIKNANLSIAVADPVASMGNISQMAEEMGGYMVSSNTYKTTSYSGKELPTASITIRVPAEKLDEALVRIKAMVEDQKLDILSEDVTGQDVTSEVNDLESRLRNLQAAETKLLVIMDNADTTEDVINIFRELTAIREEIEVIQGQIKYYRESASLSAISVYLQAKEALEPISVAGWKPGLQAQKALQALVKGGQYLVDILIWLVLFALPFLAVIFLPIYLIVKAVRNRKQKSESTKPEKKQ